MGHKGDIEARYSTNKRLPQDMIEDMRSAYSKCLKFLETEEKGIKEEDSIKIQRETAIFIMETAFRMKLTDEQKEELSSLDIEDLQKRLGEIFQEKEYRNSITAISTKPYLKRTLKVILTKDGSLCRYIPREIRPLSNCHHNL
ncbi:MAG: hypothetical protein ACYCPR_09660 [Thermoplasmataceae archaeon]